MGVGPLLQELSEQVVSCRCPATALQGCADAPAAALAVSDAPEISTDDAHLDMPVTCKFNIFAFIATYFENVLIPQRCPHLQLVRSVGSMGCWLHAG